MNPPRRFKDVLGGMPLAAEVYWSLIQRGKPLTRGFAFRNVEAHLPQWLEQASAAAGRMPSAPGRRILIFAMLRYWIEHAALLGSALAGLGHQVTLAFLPYPAFNRPYSRFDARRHNLYACSVLEKGTPLMKILPLLDVRPLAEKGLPASLLQAIRDVSVRDVQYSLQIEEVDGVEGCSDDVTGSYNGKSPSLRLYALRLERNLQAAGAILSWLQSQSPDQRPDLLLTPNGSILEMGAIYQAARWMGIPAVTYEFGEQRGRIWAARDSEVMLQETDDLWQARRDQPLTESEWEQIRALYASRQGGRLWKNFARLWQEAPSRGGEQVRQALGLDERPVVLLAANVIGDSLTLGRQIFSRDMTEWLQRSVGYFAGRPDVQLVVRIHPGERYLKGPSVANVVRDAMPDVPGHIHLVEAPDPINTYDLVEIADLGLVYTTTVGMEMAMSGAPVIVGGKTHYRGKGFTLDPQSWDEYHQLMEQVLADPEQHRLSRARVESAWNYAYRFFFEYPRPFPWHLLDCWNELETWPLERALSNEGRALFGPTFKFLAGEACDWTNPIPGLEQTQDTSLIQDVDAEFAALSRSSQDSAPNGVVSEASQPEDEVKQEVRQFYDQVGWKLVGDNIYQNARYEDLRPVSRGYIHDCHMRVARHLKPQGRYLLDAGSGPVQYPEYLEYSRAYEQRVCADISILALQEARRRMGEHGLYVVADVANLPFKPGCFEGVVSLHTIHHLPEEEHLQAFSELHRVLAPGCVAVVVNGWSYSPLMRVCEPFIRGAYYLRHYYYRLRGKRFVFDEEDDSQDNGPDPNTSHRQHKRIGKRNARRGSLPKGTYTRKHDAAWMHQEVGAQMQVEILVWRSVTVRFLRALIHPHLGGRFWLGLLFWLEERFPHFFGENGKYPLIVIKKV